jgi:hypothetical protein
MITGITVDPDADAAINPLFLRSIVFGLKSD